MSRRVFVATERPAGRKVVVAIDSIESVHDLAPTLETGEQRVLICMISGSMIVISGELRDVVALAFPSVAAASAPLEEEADGG